MTKSDQARVLLRKGMARADVARRLDMQYSRVHTLYKEVQANGQSQGRAAAVKPSKLPAAKLPSRTRKVRPLREEASDREQQDVVPRGRRRPLHLRPTQRRYYTQDDHLVVVDPAGHICTDRTCGMPVLFSLYHLGFVHEGSEDPPVLTRDDA